MFHPVHALSAGNERFTNELNKSSSVHLKLTHIQFVHGLIRVRSFDLKPL